MTPPFEGDFSHAVGDARKRLTASSGGAQGEWKAEWRGECWKCGYDGTDPHKCTADLTTDAGTRGVLTPHHYMNADGFCHAGDAFEAGTPFVTLYEAETVERILAARDAATEQRILAEREGYLDSRNLSEEWKAGWRSAITHVAARIARGERA